VRVLDQSLEKFGEKKKSALFSSDQGERTEIFQGVRHQPRKRRYDINEQMKQNLGRSPLSREQTGEGKKRFKKREGHRLSIFVGGN